MCCTTGVYTNIVVHSLKAIACSHLTSTPERNTTNSCNDRHPARLDRIHHGQQVGRTGHRSAVGHLLDVGPGTEGLVVAPCHDDQGDRVVMLGFSETFQDPHAHMIAEWIEGRVAQSGETGHGGGVAAHASSKGLRESGIRQG